MINFFKEIVWKQLAMLDQEVREEWQKVDVRDTNGLGRLPLSEVCGQREAEGGEESAAAGGGPA